MMHIRSRIIKSTIPGSTCMDIPPASAAVDFETLILLAVHFYWNQNSGVIRA
jgi:hypothetical protein